MRKEFNPTPDMRTVARYSSIAKSALSNVGQRPLCEAEAEQTEGAATKAVRLPVRIKVLEIQVPIRNPYDIGVEATLAALRRAGVLTKSGKLGRTFR